MYNVGDISMLLMEIDDVALRSIHYNFRLKIGDVADVIVMYI